MREELRPLRGALPERVVDALASGPSSCSRLALRLGVSAQRVSSALWRLRQGGLVRILNDNDPRNKIYGLGCERKPAPAPTRTTTPAPYRRGLAGWGSWRRDA